MEARIGEIAALAPVARWFARREIRAAVRGEIHGVCVALNFALLRLLEDRMDEETVRQMFFEDRRELTAVVYANADRRADFMTMAERFELLRWNGELSSRCWPP